MSSCDRDCSSFKIVSSMDFLVVHAKYDANSRGEPEIAYMLTAKKHMPRVLQIGLTILREIEDDGEVVDSSMVGAT